MSNNSDQKFRRSPLLRREVMMFEKLGINNKKTLYSEKRDSTSPFISFKKQTNKQTIEHDCNQIEFIKHFSNPKQFALPEFCPL